MKLEVELSEAMAGAISRRCVSERKTFGDVIHELLTAGLGKHAPMQSQRIVVSATFPDVPTLAHIETVKRQELKYELSIHRLYDAMDEMHEGSMRTFEQLLTPLRMQHLTSQKRSAWRRQMLNRIESKKLWRLVSVGPNPSIVRK